VRYRLCKFISTNFACVSFFFPVATLVSLEDASFKTIESVATMASSIEEVAGLVEGLTIANEALDVHTQNPSCSSSTQPNL
jgi:hypothetical protein